MDAAFTPTPARADERTTAFRLIFQHLSPHDREERVANALRLIDSGELDPQGILVVRAAQGVCGALVCARVAGAGGLVWPPGCHENAARPDWEDRLLQTAIAWLRQGGVKLAQALLSPQEAFLAESLPRNGFVHITNLWFMRHDLDLPLHLLQIPVRLRFTVYDPRQPDLFQQTLLRTYEQTRDCPEVNGIRTIEEVIAGHQAQGVYVPERWWLVWWRENPVAVLLLADVPENDSWEVAYVGVVPEARRRGLAREVLLQALCEARAAGAAHVTLSVDARNQPAWNLYRGLGFEPYDQRAVYLAVLSATNG